MNEQTRQALEMAIEALEDVHWSERTVKMENAIAPCKEALEDISKMETTSQPAQEPVAWECFSDAAYYDMWAIRQIGNRNFDETIHVVNGKEAKHLCAWLNSLNTHPTPSWQGLSDDEIEKIDEVTLGDYYKKQDAVFFARSIEQELKTKNGFSDVKEKNS